MRTISIINQKGGSGKTTTAINLAAAYARRGMPTLLVDIDPQAHCAAGLGVPENRIDYSIGEALLNYDRQSFDPDALIWEVSRNLFLAPSTIRLAGLEAPGGGLHALTDRDRRLAGLLERVGHRFERILIDCPPTIGLLTYNALRAAREALIPVETGYFAMKGAKRQWTTIRNLIERIDQPIAVHVLPTIYNPDSRVARDVLTALQRHFAGQIVPLAIHEHDELREAASFGQPVVEYAPHSKAHEDFERLIEWLESHPPQTAPRVQEISLDSGSHEDPACLHDHQEQDAQPQTASTSAAAISLSPNRHTASNQSTSSTPASSGSRAEEMVKRVREIALRNAERERHMTDEVTAALQPDGAMAAQQKQQQQTGSGEIEPLGRSPELVECKPFPPAPGQLSGIRSTPFAAQGDSAASPPPPEALSTPSVPGSTSARIDLPPAIGRTIDPDIADSESTFDAARRSEASLRIDTAEHGGSPPPAEQVRHLLGVRQTARGVLFVQPADTAVQIAVAGDFNGWSPDFDIFELNPQFGVFQLVKKLPPGRYQYRLIVDQRWIADPYNDQQVLNEHGEPNSVLVVPASSVVQHHAEVSTTSSRSAEHAVSQLT